MCNSKKACFRRYLYRLSNFQLFSKWYKNAGIPHVSLEQFMTNKTKTFAHNAGKAKMPEKSNNNNNKDKDNNDDNNANINNTSYNNNDNDEDNNNNKNTKTKGKSAVVQESADSSSRTTTTTTTTTTSTKVINKDKNQTNNKKDTLKDKAIEKNQKKIPNTKIPDSQSPTMEASDFSSMIRERGEGGVGRDGRGTWRGRGKWEGGEKKEVRIK
jgi:hypothetical protein